MSYCLNPACPNPSNPNATKYCLACGAKLLLRDRYRALEPIGRGGFGRTFAGVDEDKPSRPRCAIKQFFPEAQGTSNTQKAAELFNQEAVRLDELGKHPQIPDLLAHFEQEGHLYLVQEFIEGENLADELVRQGCFSEAQIRDLLQELLPVLQFIHDRQVIHRDIKPANIIRRHSFATHSQGSLVLVDFGAAKVVMPNMATGTVIGSPEYVAPEQVRGKAVFASDLYSLGATCIHLLTQMSPFDLFDVYRDVWVWRDCLQGNAVSPQFGRILDKLLETTLSNRYQSAAEVLADLTGQPIPARGPSQPAIPTTSTSTPSPSGRSVRPMVPPQSTQPPVSLQVLPARSPTWKCRHTLTGHLNAVTSVAFSPDSQILASGSEDKTIEIWKTEVGKRWYTLTGHADRVTCLAFSPNGQILASGSWDKIVNLWDMNKGKWWYGLSGHGDRVYAVAFSPDGQTLASGSKDKTVKLWDLNKGKQEGTLTGHGEGVYAVAFSPDRQTLVSSSRDETIRLWNLTTNTQVSALVGHTNWVRSAIFSPNGQILASASRDGTIKLWQIKSLGQGSLLRTLKDNSGDILCLAFSPDGKTLASGGRDGNIYVWDVSSGALLEILTGHVGDVLAIAFDREGRNFASGGSDRTVRMWQR